MSGYTVGIDSSLVPTVWYPIIPYRSEDSYTTVTSSMLTATNLRKMDASSRLNSLMSDCQRCIDADEDASHLLTQIQAELAVTDRPHTGQSIGRPATAASIQPSIAGSLGPKIKATLRERRDDAAASWKPPPTASSIRSFQRTKLMAPSNDLMSQVSDRRVWLHA